MSVSVTSYKIQSFDESSSWVDLVSGIGSFDQVSIGTRCRTVAEFTAFGTDVFVGGDVMLQPWLFANLGSNLNTNPAAFGSIGWYSNIPATGIGNLYLTGTSGSGGDQENITGYYDCASNTELTVYFEFVMTADINNKLLLGSSSANTPVKRIYNDSIFNTASLVNSSGNSPYSITKKVVMSYLINSIADTVFTPYLFNRENKIDARFYDQGLYGGTKELENVSYGLEVLGLPVTSLSIYNDTKVWIKYLSDSAASYKHTVTDMYAYVYKVNGVNANLNFLSAMDTSKGFITTNAGNTQVDGVIYNPSVLDTGTVYPLDTESSFTIDANSLVSGGIYSIVIVLKVKDNVSGGFFYNSFIINDVITGQPAGSLDLEDIFSTTVKTWQKETVDANVTDVALAQRQVIRCTADQSAYDSLATAAGLPFVDFKTDCTKIDFELYNETDSVSIAQWGIVKTVSGWDAQILSAFIKFEDDTLILDTNLLFRALYGEGIGVIPNFIGKTITYRFTYKFDYAPTNNPFSHSYRKDVSITYRELNCGTEAYEDLHYLSITDENDNPLGSNLVGVDKIKVTVGLDSLLTDTDYIFIPYIDKYAFGAALFNNNNLEEQNLTSSIDSTLLPNLSTPKIILTNDEFTASKGTFLIDVDELDFNTDYTVIVTTHKKA